jgi:dihydrodipicolinate synthase/N-acetylneuraminate lyase
LSVAAGAAGAITASGNYAWALNRTVVEHARSGDPATAADQARLRALAGAVERHGLPGTKEAAALAGLVTGSVRAPLVPAPAETRTQVAETLAAAGIGA